VAEIVAPMMVQEMQPNSGVVSICRKMPVAEKRVYLNHVSIALGSHEELATCIEIAFRLRYLSPEGKRTLLDMFVIRRVGC